MIVRMQIQPPERFHLTPDKGPSAKSLQTINAEVFVENCVPSTCWRDVKW